MVISSSLLCKHKIATEIHICIVTKAYISRLNNIATEMDIVGTTTTGQVYIIRVTSESL